MELSKELLDILLILLPGLISFIIIESLIPYNKIEFNRLIIFVIALSAMSFFIVNLLWEIYLYLAVYLNIPAVPQKLNLNETIFSYHSNTFFTCYVFIISIILGLFFAWAISNKIIYKIINKIYTSNMTSNMEVWDDFFGTSRENAFVVVRDKENNLMYYGEVLFYSISATSKIPALFLKDVDVFLNEDSSKLYNVKELYLPFNKDKMTVEFPNFEEGGTNE